MPSSRRPRPPSTRCGGCSSEEERGLPGRLPRRAALTTLAIGDRVQGADVVAWWMDAFRELHRAVRVSGATRAGTDGALFPTEFFADEVGDLVAFVPVDGGAVPPARPGHGVRRAGRSARGDHLRRPAARPRPCLRRRRSLGLRPGHVVARARCASATSPPATRTISSLTPPRSAGPWRNGWRSRRSGVPLSTFHQGMSMKRHFPRRTQPGEAPVDLHTSMKLPCHPAALLIRDRTR